MNKNYFTNITLCFFYTMHQLAVSCRQLTVFTANCLLQTRLHVPLFHFAYGVVNRAGGKGHIGKRWILTTG